MASLLLYFFLFSPSSHAGGLDDLTPQILDEVVASYQSGVRPQLPEKLYPKGEPLCAMYFREGRFNPDPKSIPQALIKYFPKEAKFRTRQAIIKSIGHLYTLAVLTEAQHHSDPAYKKNRGIRGTYEYDLMLIADAWEGLNFLMAILSGQMDLSLGPEAQTALTEIVSTLTGVATRQGELSTLGREQSPLITSAIKGLEKIAIGTETIPVDSAMKQAAEYWIAQTKVDDSSWVQYIATFAGDAIQRVKRLREEP